MTSLPKGDRGGCYTPREIIEALQKLPELLMDYPSVHAGDLGAIFIYIKKIGDVEISVFNEVAIA